MARLYKVWIEIEQCDDAAGEYLTLDAPDAAVATFTSYGAAWRFAEKLQQHGYTVAAAKRPARRRAPRAAAHRRLRRVGEGS